jgi:multiple antibiotic resistance protein
VQGIRFIDRACKQHGIIALTLMRAIQPCDDASEDLASSADQSQGRKPVTGGRILKRVGDVTMQHAAAFGWNRANTREKPGEPKTLYQNLPHVWIMADDLLSFVLLSFSSMIIVINPLTATLIYVSLTDTMDRESRIRIAWEASRFALIILLVFTIAGGWILQLFGITIEAFRIAGGLLLFGIGMEMVYAKTSRTKMTATEKYEGQEADDIAVMPLAIPMITGPGAITTAIVLMNEAMAMNPVALFIVPLSVIVSILITYYMMRNADYITKRIGQREYRAINRLMGMLLIAIAVQFVILGIQTAFPLLKGG